MGATPDDWRRRGQEPFLQGARLTLKRYQALTAQWEHEHCAFCWHKFLDPSYAESHRRALEQQPGEHSAEGYTTLKSDTVKAGEWWICKRCFEDFKVEFGWVVSETDPKAWPYEQPEPDRRPTAADYTPPDEGLVQRHE